MEINGVKYNKVWVADSPSDAPPMPRHYVVTWPDGAISVMTVEGIADTWEAWRNYNADESGPNGIWALTPAGPRKVTLHYRSSGADYPMRVTVIMGWTEPTPTGGRVRHRDVTFDYVIRES